MTRSACGEDGPTHQPVEHATALRVIPNLDVWRPCDGVETAVAWRCALERAEGPTALLLSRQNLPQYARDESMLVAIAAGGYVLSEAATGAAGAVIIATGSEVAIALDAQKRLAARGIAVRVVSMPSTTRFDAQLLAYQRSVLPPGLPRVAVEAAHPDFWRKYVGLEGRVIGIATFGESAPASALYEHFGLTSEAVAAAVVELVIRGGPGAGGVTASTDMAAHSAPADLGSLAPDFALPGTCGQIWTRDAAAGPNGLLVMFICNHCPYVQAVLDRIVRDARELQAAGIGVVAISSNDAAAYPEDSFEQMQRLWREKDAAVSVPVRRVPGGGTRLRRGVHAGFLRLRPRPAVAVPRADRCVGSPARARRREARTARRACC